MEKALLPRLKEAREWGLQEERLEDAKNVERLIEELRSTETGVRERASLELGRIGDRGAIEALIEALDGEVYAVRRSAIYALGWMQAKEAVRKLLELASGTEDIWTKRSGLSATEGGLISLLGA